MKKQIIRIAATVMMSLIFIGFKHLMGFENTVLFAMACVYMMNPKSSDF